MEEFNFKRFWNVFRLELTKIKTIYIATAVFILSVIVLADTLLMIPQIQRNIVLMIADVSKGLLFIGVIYSSMMFAYAGWNKTMIPDLMQPASTAEKFWAKFSVFWLIPALFAFFTIWITPQLRYDGSEVSTWEGARLLFCLYLCFSGIMILAGAIFFKKAAGKMLGVLVGIIIFSTIMLANFGKNIPKPEWIHQFGNYLAAESYRITIFQLAVGFLVVTVCTAIAYRRFKRLTLKH